MTLAWRSVALLVCLAVPTAAQTTFSVSGGVGVTHADGVATAIGRLAADASVGPAVLTLRNTILSPDGTGIRDVAGLLGLRTKSRPLPGHSGAVQDGIWYFTLSAGPAAWRREPACAGPCAAESGVGPAAELTARVAYPHVAIGAALGGTHANDRSSWVGLSLFLALGKF